MLDSRVQTDAAVILDWDSWWAAELDARPSSDGLRYLEGVYGLYKPLWEANVTVDFVRPDADLSRYKLVLAPHLHLVRDDAAANLELYVGRGGVLVMGFFSGIVDEHDHIRLGGYPAPFRKLLGLTVEEFDALPEGRTLSVGTEHESFAADLWADVLTLEGAEALAAFGEGFYAGHPAVTEHTFGSGTSFYYGTRLNAAGTRWLLNRACERAGVARPELPEGVELVRRVADGRSYLALLNHHGESVRVELAEAGTDLVTGEKRTGELELPPYGVVFLEQDDRAA